MRRVAAALLAVLLAAAAARPENASATLLPGDRLHGNILNPGETDRLLVYLPKGASFSAEALAEKGSAILPALEVLDPLDAPVPLGGFTVPGPGGVGVRVKNAPAGPTGGIFEFLVTASGGTSGKYRFRVTARMVKKVLLDDTLAPAESVALPFDAPAGSKLKYRVRPGVGVPEGAVAMEGLRDPGDIVTPLAELAGKGILLDEDGPWSLEFGNVGGAPAAVLATVNLTLPRTSRRQLWLSPFGFGEAPRVLSVTPKKVLDDRPAPDVQIVGRNFDPGALVRLERTGQDPVEPTGFTVDDDETITADFDPTGLKPGGWKVVVENPSGAVGRGKLAVQSASSVKLPAGAQPATEVWWLDFDEDAFPADLDEMGLQSPSSSGVSALAEAAVKSYAVRYLRLAFGLEPLTGKVEAGSVPVSFVVKRPAAVVGEPGSEYNRLRIGGQAAGGDPSSNPNYPWGNSVLDPGNAAYDDVVPEAGAGLGVRTRALAPSLAGSLAPYYNALKALRDRPLTSADGKYFLTGFAAKDAVEGARYREIVLAVKTAGQELGGTLAHFVARSMGLADGASGPSAVPAKTGEYAALLDPALSGAERTQLEAAARTGLPGTAKALKASYFPYSETRDYLLPNATTTEAYAQAFDVAGGRPERDPLELEFDGVLGAIPAGFSISLGGTVSGTAPLRNPDTTLAGGVYRFLVRMKDTVTGETIFFAHRINLLVDIAELVNPVEIAQAQNKNAATLATP